MLGVGVSTCHRFRGCGLEREEPVPRSAVVLKQNCGVRKGWAEGCGDGVSDEGLDMVDLGRGGEGPADSDGDHNMCASVES